MSIFSSVKVAAPKRSGFRMDHDVKLTFDPGYLIPVMMQDVLPGDHWRVDANAFVRMMPMLAPVMQRFDLKLEAFFVPNRLLFKDWPEFITGGDDGTSDIALPEILCNRDNAFDVNHLLINGSLADYLEFPTIDSSEDFNDYLADNQQVALPSAPFKAYQLVYNEYYRDENLTLEVDILKDDYNTIVNPIKVRELMTLRKRCWRKDYFTSALPWVQRGSDVLIPIGNQNTTVQFTPGNPTFIYPLNGQRLPATQDGKVGLYGSVVATDPEDQLATLYASSSRDIPGEPEYVNRAVSIDNSDSLSVDTSNTTSSINDLRTAYAIQRWKERNAVGGARYKEQLLAHFGVTVPDATIQRPLFLGAASSPVVIGEINQTSQSTTSQSPSGASVLGGFSGHGVGINDGHLFDHTFNEHGWVMVLLSFIPRASYSQGWPRKYSRKDRYDYAFPEFVNLGEQAIYEKEIMFNWPARPYTLSNDKVFGYQSRYAEYKFIQSHIHGDFKGSLDYWHAGRIFANSPSLNTGFVTCNPTSRIFAVRGKLVDEETGEMPDVPTAHQHHLLAEVAFTVKAVRPLTKYGTPI